MTNITKLKSGFAAAALTLAMGTTALVALPTVAAAQTASKKTVTLSIGEGQQINLSTTITDVVVADPTVADVEVKSSKQIYIIGKGPGSTDVYATDAAGRTVYRAAIQVGGNLSSLDQMLLIAMPDADIKVTTMGNVVLLTGTVAQPEDAAEAERLATAFVATTATGNSAGTTVINRLKNATPLQVNLQVRIAEVSRSLAKEIGGNIQASDSGSNFLVGGLSGRDFVNDAGEIVVPAGVRTIAGIGRLFGIDIGAAFDLSEQMGLASTLANPNLTTVSGETADFLAGGSFPIPVSSGLGATSVEFRDYGVGLTYTPTVLSNGRISLRVRTEVSDITSQGAVRLGGLEIPATTQRMAETTIELGSGQSMMIAGLLSNNLGSSVDKMPGLGDVPVLGALFKSNGWRRRETELMIVITPYLVKPVSESEISLPTDGLHSPDDLQRALLGKVSTKDGAPRPIPVVAPPASGPALSSVSDTAPAMAKKSGSVAVQTAAAPGFSFDN